MERNRTATFIEPRGPARLLEGLREADGLRYAVTGTLAAAPMSEYAPARFSMVYVDDIYEAGSRLGLREPKSGANIVLAEPFDDVVYERAAMRDGVRYAAPSQVGVDLLTGPGRNPSEGEDLIRWMKENEFAWRL